MFVPSFDSNFAPFNEWSKPKNYDLWKYACMNDMKQIATRQQTRSGKC